MQALTLHAHMTRLYNHQTGRLTSMVGGTAIKNKTISLLWPQSITIISHCFPIFLITFHLLLCTL